MDSETSILALIVILTCMIPIILLKGGAVFKKRKFGRLLSEAAQKHNTTIIQYEQWNNSAIGLNKNATQLFIVNKGEAKATSKTLVLSSFNKCSVVNENSGAAYKEGSFKVTNAIELELTGENSRLARINFYHIDKDSPLLTDELELAEKWCRIINDCITPRIWLHPDQRK